MKSYSIHRMRQERQPVFRFIISLAAACLAMAAVCGALWKVLDNCATRQPLIFSGVFLMLFLFLMGFYLLESDAKQLMKKTVFGRALVDLEEKKGTNGRALDGKRNAGQIMAEIDEEAHHMLYECSRFALMPQWMVIYRWMPQPFFRNTTVASVPVMKRWIARIHWEKAERGENSEYEVFLKVSWNPAPYKILVAEQADIEALRAWGAVQEQEKREI